MPGKNRKFQGPTTPTVIQNREPTGFERISDLAAVVSLSPPDDSLIATIQAEHGHVRWRDDGSNPTGDIGMLLLDKTEMVYDGNLRALELIQETLPDLKLAIDTNFDVQTGERITLEVEGVTVTVNAATTIDTGAAKDIAIDQWAAMLISVDSAGNLTATFTADAANEAAAIVLLKALIVPSGERPIGYVTIQTGSGVNWLAGTDALQGGTGGDPATTTNYYNYLGTKLNASYYK